MKIFFECVLLFFAFVACSAIDDFDGSNNKFRGKNVRSIGYDPDINLDPAEMIRRAGYAAEAHVVKTLDGYLLTLHRIPGRPGSSPVFLQHGLLSSSADWLVTGRDKALPYMLAEQGFDVWLGNFRGNTYSRAHTTLSPSDPKFWNFSWHESGVYDLPAMILYVSKISGTILEAYVGHSMGTTAFYVMASELPEFGDMVRGMYSLAPVAFMGHMRSPIRYLAPIAREYEIISKILGDGELLPQSSFIRFLAKYTCNLNTWEEKICSNSIFVLCGFDKAQFNYTLLPVILGHTPAGASTRQLTHYAQEFLSGKFRRYDYGTEGNSRIYNSTVPPKYNLSRITVPIGLFYGDNDLFASITDVKRLYTELNQRLCRPCSDVETLKDYLFRMDEVLSTPPTFQLSFADHIYCVEFSPYEWSQHLICIALKEEIIIGSVKFQDEDDTVEDFAYTPIRTFHHDTRPQAIAWSPEASLSVVPKILMFCVAGTDFKIRSYNSNINDVNTYEILEGHRDYINAIFYEPEGELLASVSDDHTCKLWTVKEDQKCITTFYLTSPGMGVCWHVEESGKLLVAEKNGLIHLYNVRSQQAIMSFDAGTVPLMSVDWGPNPLKVVSLAAGELLLWDVSRPSRPLESRTLHIEGGMVVRLSPANENLVASVGRPDNLLKVTNLKSKQVILCSRAKLIGSLTWHYNLPYVCAGSDRELSFWRVNIA
ncbi:hypothetical protein KM043_017599 [Ampulex compressa]|nr:hypothetical protein KM043_017599 [Ampulex compressa]